MKNISEVLQEQVGFAYFDKIFSTTFEQSKNKIQYLLSVHTKLLPNSWNIVSPLDFINYAKTKIMQIKILFQIQS